MESRLATLTLDREDLEKLSVISAQPDLPASLQQGNVVEIASGLPVLFNTLNMRRAIIPAANGHCSARALARYYAALVTGGSIPPPHSHHSNPLLGSHIHTPKFPSLKKPRKKKGSKDKEMGDSKPQNGSVVAANGIGNPLHNGNDHSASMSNDKGYSLIANADDEAGNNVRRIFSNPKIHDAFMGVGDYSRLVIADGKFGLGFRRYKSGSSKFTSFGHSGIGGSIGFCNIEHDFSIALTVNKMSLGSVPRSIIQLVCSELKIPLPEEFSMLGERGPDMQLNLGQQS